MIKHHEFWNPRLFELPFYFYLAWQCLKHRVWPRDLAKANSALDHGEIGIGSKFHTQQQFPQQQFLPTELLQFSESTPSKEQIASNLQIVDQFVAAHGYPLIFKPDIGMVGKGILKIKDREQLVERISDLRGAYILQKFTSYAFEYGVFYTRKNGQSRITGINQKHFPTITGNGVDSIRQLANAHERFSQHWGTFLQYIDTSRVPEKGEQVRLSFIGSHTMGCKFTDNCDLSNEALEKSVFALLDAQPDFNYGRIDVKAESEAAFVRGDFVVIEVNGVSSLPAHMFDPSYSLFECYRIFFSHGRQLVEIAKENAHKPMHLLPFFNILKRVKINQSKLDDWHNELKEK